MNAGHSRDDIDHLVDVLEANQHLAGSDKRFAARRDVPVLQPLPSL